MTQNRIAFTKMYITSITSNYHTIFSLDTIQLSVDIEVVMLYRLLIEPIKSLTNNF